MYFISTFTKKLITFTQSCKATKFFSTLDLHSGYHHISLLDRANPKTVFVVSGMGKFEFNRVSFGLAQALAYF